MNPGRVHNGSLAQKILIHSQKSVRGTEHVSAMSYNHATERDALLRLGLDVAQHTWAQTIGHLERGYAVGGRGQHCESLVRPHSMTFDLFRGLLQRN